MAREPLSSSPVWKEVVLPIALAGIVAYTAYLNHLTLAKAESIDKKADHITETVNSNLSEVQTNLGRALDKIELLEKSLAERGKP